MSLTFKTATVISLIGMAVTGAWIGGDAVHRGDLNNRTYSDTKTETLRLELKSDLNVIKASQIEQTKELAEHGVTLKLIESMIKERMSYGRSNKWN